MKVFVLFLSVIVASAYGAAVNYFPEDDDLTSEEIEWDENMDLQFGMPIANSRVEDKKPCCVPNQWEAFLYYQLEYVVERRPHDEDDLNDVQANRPRPRPRPRPRRNVVVEFMQLHADFTNGRMAVEDRIYSRAGEKNVSVIVDAGKRKMFVFDTDKKACHVGDFPGNITSNCFPNGTKYIGSARFGLGDNSVNFDTFGFRLRSRQMGLNMIASVTSDTCAPISEVGMGRKGPVFFRFTTTYMNITPGIKDPKSFDPPSYCTKELFGNDLDEMMQDPVAQFATQKFGFN